MNMKRLRRRPLLLGTVAAVLALLAAIGATAWASIDDHPKPKVDATLRFDPSARQPSGQGLIGRDTQGQAVPTDQFPKLGSGLASLADYRGKPLVVNFFGSWCVPCRKETPDLEKVHRRLGDKVAILGLAVHDSASSAAAFVKENHVTYDVARDPSDNIFTAMGALQVPSTFLVSADGHIVASHTGAVTAEALLALLATKVHVS